MSQEFIAVNYPMGWAYLIENRVSLEDREKGRMRHSEFFAYIYPKNLTEFDAVKIMTPEIAIQPQLTIDPKGKSYHTTIGL